ncbi:hypothetical protein KC345_g277 [Hortaea werneckii]|nr:hypothetical protein KC345_g277 [Hortaea werneckii]
MSRRISGGKSVMKPMEGAMMRQPFIDGLLQDLQLWNQHARDLIQQTSAARIRRYRWKTLPYMAIHIFIVALVPLGTSYGP